MVFLALLLTTSSGALAGARSSSRAVGVHSFAISDSTRRDPIAASHIREWRVDLYYTALKGGAASPRPYAPDPRLIDRMIKSGYYDIPASQIQAWKKKPGPALMDAPVAKRGSEVPLVVIAPGSGVAAFNYSELAAAFVRRSYVVAVVDLPYVGISRLQEGRFLDGASDPIQQKDDPISWRPRVRQWSADISRVLDRLLQPGSPDLPKGLRIDPRRIVITGHSLGGSVALQVCRDDERVEACGDFEGAPMAADTYDKGSQKPLFVTAARSAKVDRPFKVPDLSDEFWSYLRRSGPSSWAVAITRASHMSYSDAPFELPSTLSRFGGELINPERSFDVYVGLVDAFARAYTPGGRGDRAFREYVDSTPEILARRTGESR